MVTESRFTFIDLSNCADDVRWCGGCSFLILISSAVIARLLLFGLILLCLCSDPFDPWSMLANKLLSLLGNEFDFSFHSGLNMDGALYFGDMPPAIRSISKPKSLRSSLKIAVSLGEREGVEEGEDLQMTLDLSPTLEMPLFDLPSKVDEFIIFVSSFGCEWVFWTDDIICGSERLDALPIFFTPLLGFDRFRLLAFEDGCMAFEIGFWPVCVELEFYVKLNGSKKISIIIAAIL